MPSITVIMLDNTYSSQNQDYLPSRITLQKEIVRSVLSRVFEADPENMVGIIPLAQESAKDLLTPTKNRAYLQTFIDKLDLYPNIQCYSTLYQADLSLQQPNITTKNLVIFLSSPHINEEELLSVIFSIASRGIIIKVVCFADAQGIAAMLKKEVDFDSFACLCLDSDANFNEEVLRLLGSSMDVHDPELEEAIRRSLQQ